MENKTSNEQQKPALQQSYVSGSLDNPERIVECCNCEHRHRWDEREIKKDDLWTIYTCPNCGDESYTNCR